MQIPQKKWLCQRAQKSCLKRDSHICQQMREDMYCLKLQTATAHLQQMLRSIWMQKKADFVRQIIGETILTEAAHLPSREVVCWCFPVITATQAELR